MKSMFFLAMAVAFADAGLECPDELDKPKKKKKFTLPPMLAKTEEDKANLEKIKKTRKYKRANRRNKKKRGY